MNKLVAYVKKHPRRVIAGTLAVLGTVSQIAAALVAAKDEDIPEEKAIEVEGWVK